MPTCFEPACILKEGTWLDFREKVKKVEPELFKIIEKISPDNKYKLIQADYLFGESITDLGTICVPNQNGRLVRLDDLSVSSKLKDQLGYCPTPLILQLENASEVFVDAEGRIIPLNVFHEGDLYGLYEILVPFTGCLAIPCWSITSGARSVFMASKVSDAIGHKKLKKEYGLTIESPKSLADQWHVIKELANCIKKENPWKTKVLIFTKKWFEDKKDNIHWLQFQNYLMKKAWWQSRSNRADIEYSITWERLAKEVKTKKLRPNSYIVDTVKHLMLLTTGMRPGFRPAENELLFPTRIIENAYTNIYGLKEYAAFVMQPYFFNNKNGFLPVYYSMTYPTLLLGSPDIRKSAKTMTELREVMALLKVFSQILGFCEDRIYQTLKNIEFKYFHSDKDRLGMVLSNQNIAKKDIIISKALKTKFKGKIFPSYGPFFRGCIKVSLKKKTS